MTRSISYVKKLLKIREMAEEQAVVKHVLGVTDATNEWKQQKWELIKS
jgi:hypothetical protein